PHSPRQRLVVVHLLNVVDVEATCWEGDPPAGEEHEIIEIGLTVVDLDGRRRLAKHQVLVRPERSSMSDFCAELTGLTREQVEGGISFGEACELLVSEYRTDMLPWASWGDYDRRQFLRQCEGLGIAYPFSTEHSNAKARFAELRGLRRRPGMARALEIAGLPLEGRHHSGADDAWNIAGLVLSMLPD
ncbi:MAG TPA: 3'-5' exonuclease, partial [Kribbella sp.]|nr:3'-5' exonuclease [Kribbella sp.]